MNDYRMNESTLMNNLAMHGMYTASNQRQPMQDRVMNVEFIMLKNMPFGWMCQIAF